MHLRFVFIKFQITYYDMIAFGFGLCSEAFWDWERFTISLY